VIYDSIQVLVVDIGKADEDATDIQKVLSPLLVSRTLNGFFLTHGHPDHVTQAWKMVQLYEAPIYVGSEAVKVEMVNLMRQFGWRLFNNSNPGNPDGNATKKFDYGGPQVQVVTSSRQLWNGAGKLVVHNNEGLVAETNHYAWLDFTDDVTGSKYFFVGDLVYTKTHIFMGLDVSIQAQCDWIAALNSLTEYVESLKVSVVNLFPGHGVPTPNILDAISDHITYVEFARGVYVSNCNATTAGAIIQAKFSTYADPALLVGFSAPFRAPADAQNLGCQCSQTVQSCNIDPPPCEMTQKK
jgi:glyoxylase-like metal-dependent hydrolase (beta-lactamase superfamily II)